MFENGGKQLRSISVVALWCSAARGLHLDVPDFRAHSGAVKTAYALRDKVGSHLSVWDWTGVCSYGYDAMNRLTSASYGGRTMSNTWDADSNRLGMNANGTAR